jgi:hypothetical protein
MTRQFTFQNVGSRYPPPPLPFLCHTALVLRLLTEPRSFRYLVVGTVDPAVCGSGTGSQLKIEERNRCEAEQSKDGYGLVLLHCFDSGELSVHLGDSDYSSTWGWS